MSTSSLTPDAAADQNGGLRIVRSKHAQSFVVIGNDVARDSRLSFRARGLHHYLLSLPPGWHTTLARIAAENPEGRDAVYAAFDELIEHGYASRERHQDERGRWNHSFTVYDMSQAGTPGDGKTPGQSTYGFPGVGLPGIGNPGVNKKDGKKKERRQKTETSSPALRAPDQEPDDAPTNRNLKPQAPAAGAARGDEPGVPESVIVEAARKAVGQMNTQMSSLTQPVDLKLFTAAVRESCQGQDISMWRKLLSELPWGCHVPDPVNPEDVPYSDDWTDTQVLTEVIRRAFWLYIDNITTAGNPAGYFTSKLAVFTGNVTSSQDWMEKAFRREYADDQGQAEDTDQKEDPDDQQATR